MSSTPAYDHVLLDATLCTLSESRGYGRVERGAVAWRGGSLVHAGPADGLDAAALATAPRVDRLHGALVTPGLIDCHTHLVFAGDRAHEFALRLEGASYEAIARSGGGIVSTVRKTREADEDALLHPSLRRARALRDEGVTTLEIKSGYGLDTASETKMLRVARRLGETLGITVRTTFLGAHALPPEFARDRAGYLRRVCEEMLPAVAREGLADAVDAFCEGIGFSPVEVAEVFAAAQALGLPVKLHADQLSDLGGAALAARFGALSADHLEYTDAVGVAAMAAAGTVAVLLPGAYYCLRETRLPPIDAFRAAGVPMAVATDLNPGTSPLVSLLAAINLACTLFRLTPEEALRGATVHAARALGLGARKGQLRAGYDADLVVWDAQAPEELAYWIGLPRTRQVIAGGIAIAPSAGEPTVTASDA